MAKIPQKNAVMNYSEELAKYAKASAETEASVALGKFLSVKGAKLSFNGNPIPGNKMNVVVIDSVIEHHYYEENYDVDNPSSPVCFAFGREEKTMAPHDESQAKQADACKGCPQNEFGTARVGKGKACKNIRRLSLITEDALSDVENAEVAYLKVPVTSVKAWAGYVQQLNSAMSLPPLGVVTEISVVPDDKTQLKVGFKFVEKVGEAALGAILAKRKTGEAALMQPYSAFEKKEAPVRGAKPAKFIRR